MQVVETNDVKIYNLSAGKSLPDWLEEQKRKKAKSSSSKDHSKSGIQLLQDLDMPVVSTRLQISRDGQYIVACGTYKPRMKCFEVAQLGIKFERCFDSEAVAFTMLSDDYSKLLFLHCDRYVEVHAQFGRYYRMRIPRVGRDLLYHPTTCDAYFAGDGADITRLNLEQGRFLSPLTTESSGSNVIALNPEHHLVCVGTVDGKVEAWDPRSRQRVGVLDCLRAGAGHSETATSNNTLPEVTALNFRDGLNAAVGLSNGLVQLYDIRSPQPLLVKDHMYGLPIKKVLFHGTHDHVMSLDAKVLKIWDRQTGRAFTSVESDKELNDLAVYPDSGLLFMTNEQPKVQAHYLPSLGPAPKWCSFLDSLTEEMEESQVRTVYDDYKFVTQQEIQTLGLDHLIGTDMLRAYMHGYFMDVRLYRKAQSLAEPYTMDKFLKEKIEKKLAEKREQRVQVARDKALPKVNKDLFLKLKDRQTQGKKDAELLQDDRFKDMFSDQKFAVDETEDAYKLLNPVISKMDEAKRKKLEKEFAEVEEDDDDDGSSSESDGGGGGAENNSDIEFNSSDDDLSEEEERLARERAERSKSKKKGKKEDKKSPSDGVKFYELKDGHQLSDKQRKKSRKSLADLLSRQNEHGALVNRSDGGHQMTFTKKKTKRQVQEELDNKKHIEERKAVRRATGGLKNRHKRNL